MNEYRNVILQGDVRARLLELPDASVQCIVTSPPYWGLRDYKIEPTIWGGDENCDQHFLDPALCGGWYEPRATASEIVAKAVDTLKGIG
jgi:DNA modification methylase